MTAWTEWIEKDQAQAQAQVREQMRAGHMKRHHPVGRQLDLLTQLAGGALLYVRSTGVAGDRWMALIPRKDKNLPFHRVEIPLSSTLSEARAALAAGVGEALGG